MDIEQLATSIADLTAQVKALRAEADIRRLQTRYMFLCDTPCPEPGVNDDAERIRRILDLYTDDAVWEGVGSCYGEQFGSSVGKAAIGHHFATFWAPKRTPALLFNVHYLTSEQIHVAGDDANGQWLHCQPWIFRDGSSLLRSSRLNNLFRRVDGVWKIARTRTENVFVAPLEPGWAERVASTSVVMIDQGARLV